MCDIGTEVCRYRLFSHHTPITFFDFAKSAKRQGPIAGGIPAPNRSHTQPATSTISDRGKTLSEAATYPKILRGPRGICSLSVSASEFAATFNRLDRKPKSSNQGRSIRSALNARWSYCTFWFRNPTHAKDPTSNRFSAARNGNALPAQPRSLELSSHGATRSILATASPLPSLPLPSQSRALSLVHLFRPSVETFAYRFLALLLSRLLSTSSSRGHC